jgi:hypothetical protein
MLTNVSSTIARDTNLVMTLRNVNKHYGVVAGDINIVMTLRNVNKHFWRRFWGRLKDNMITLCICL